MREIKIKFTPQQQVHCVSVYQLLTQQPDVYQYVIFMCVCVFVSRLQ